MNYVISVETRDEMPVTLYWNRRKSEWQKSINKSCLYPTYAGGRNIFKEMAYVNWPYIHGKRVEFIRYKAIEKDKSQ